MKTRRPQYMTQGEKRRVLERWQETKDQWERNQREHNHRHVGGMGYPDVAIYPLVDRINQHRNVVTLQSCSGHRRSGKRWSVCGNLWLWLSRSAATKARKHAVGLASHHRIERVWCIFQHDGQEVWSISFQGLNINRRAFEESGSAIMAFLRKCQ